ncbi:MAG TPA: 1-acyl-sn-glycerol-3-phosphate acyltransferase [Thermoanaerobaculia bacterium]|jgi:glycerol-3-phosphate O-acyltransferase|nr:1-acyl-sn-glycerol-3-phosphate acyltransferase [Thermoanaerobaculia bacterium]
MSHQVTLPLWLLLLLVLLAAWAALYRLLLPSVRWFWRSRANRVLEEVRSRFQIEIRPFQLTRRRVLIDRLVYDAQVVEAAQAFAQEEGMPREVAMAKVERYAREIVPAFNAYFYFRLGYWAARWTARLLYRVRLGAADEAALLAVPRDAAVVFVINHRSNMDYLLVGHLAASRTALSYAVGEWARIWPLEGLLKAMGAYFVRRRSRNALYRRVLERYVQMATAAGVPQAIFPEGGLSRDGKLGAAKLGLLDYMVKAFDPAASHDVVFVPVAVNYDRVLEDRTLLLDGTPEASRPGTLGAVANLAGFVGRQLWLVVSGRWHRFGYACVSFGSPLSLAQWCSARGFDPRPLGREERFARVGELAGELMARIGTAVPVVPVALVATVLRREPERSFSALELAAEAYALLHELQTAGAHVYLPRQDVDYALTVGLRMLRLRRLVVEDEAGLLRLTPGEERTVAYYANSIAHLRGVMATPALPTVRT